MIRRVTTIAEMTVRDLVRRRAAFAIFLVLPLVFFLAQHAKLGQSIRLASLGLAWSVATLALFAGATGRRLDDRLRLGGYRPAELVGGRYLAVTGLGAVAGVVYLVVMQVDKQPPRLDVIATQLFLGVAIAAAVGAALSEALPRELEGTLTLLAVVGLQMVTDPRDVLAQVLPLWSMRELGTYAIDGTGPEFLQRGLAHGAAALALALAALAFGSARRLRVRTRAVPTRKPLQAEG